MTRTRSPACCPRWPRCDASATTHQDRRSDLDDPRYHAFWSSLVIALAASAELELALAEVDGELVAYDIGLLDGTAYRIWDGRFAPRRGGASRGTGAA